MDTRHKYCVSYGCHADINMMYLGYQSKILCIVDTKPKKMCIMDTGHKYCASCIPDINNVFQGY